MLAQSGTCAIDLRGADEIVASADLADSVFMAPDAGGRIAASASPEAAELVLDSTGCIVLPGFVDQHIHGVDGFRCYGHTNPRDAVSHLKGMAERLPRFGVTSFAPTTMAEDFDSVALVCEASEMLRDAQTPGLARSLGVHLEGPFLAESACGAHDASKLRFADNATLEALGAAVAGEAVLMTFAPEAVELASIRDWSQVNGVRLSVGHSTRPASDLPELVAVGGGRVTHLFNALGGLDHRAASISLGALLRDDVTCELICDGHLVHSEWLHLAIRMLGPDRIVAVSDAIDLAGDPPQAEGMFAGTAVEWNGAGYIAPDSGRVWSSGRLLDFAATRLKRDLGLSWDAVALMTSAGLRDDDLSGKSRLSIGQLLDCVILRSDDLKVVATVAAGHLAHCAEAHRVGVL